MLFDMQTIVLPPLTCAVWHADYSITSVIMCCLTRRLYYNLRLHTVWLIPYNFTLYIFTSINVLFDTPSIFLPSLTYCLIHPIYFYLHWHTVWHTLYIFTSINLLFDPPYIFLPPLTYCLTHPLYFYLH